MEDVFRPDLALKTYFQEMSSPTLIRLLNGLYHKNYPTTAKVHFRNTEHYKVLGDLEKQSVRGDLTIALNYEQREEVLIVEFQSTLDAKMGLRVFVYSLNELQAHTSKPQTFQLPPRLQYTPFQIYLNSAWTKYTLLVHFFV